MSTFDQNYEKAVAAVPLVEGNSARLATEWEKIWDHYIVKLNRLRDLKEQGRYGYQLRMPKYSLSLATKAVRDFCRTHGMDSPI